jgi:hypothetical protein
MVRELHRGGVLEAGRPGARWKICSVGCATDATMNRIDKAWDALAREPSIGDVVWLYRAAAAQADL